jgi:hypothetical protein
MILEVKSTEMKNPKYSIIVRSYLFDQKRIQLTLVDAKDETAPEGHGVIVREFCTYNKSTCDETVSLLKKSSEPEEFAKTLERPGNCEGPGGRIRLDNQETDL